MLRIPMNCNYQVIISDNLPAFYEEILSSFNELPARYNSDPYGKSFSSTTKKSKWRKGFRQKKKSSPKDRPWTFSTLMTTLHRRTVMPTHGYDLHRNAPINVNPWGGGGGCGQGGGMWQILKFFDKIPQGGKRKVNQKCQKRPHPRGKI